MGERIYELEPRGPYSLRLTFVGTEPAFPSIYDGRSLWRVVRTSSGVLVPLRVEQEGALEEPLLRVSVLSGRVSNDDVEEALEALSWFLCVEDDLSTAYARMEADPVLSPVLEHLRGMMPWTAFSPLEGIVDAIVFQQISLKVAFSLIRRFVEGLGERLEVGGRILYAFPRLEDILGADRDRLRALGLSKNKASYILGVAEAVERGLELESLRDKPLSEALKALTALRGVGRWTAELFLATGLKRWEVVPADDLGVRRAFARFYGLENPKGEQVREITSRWGEDAWPIAYYLLVASERMDRVLGAAEEDSF